MATIHEVNQALKALAEKSKPRMVLLTRSGKAGSITSLAERLKAAKLMKQIRSLNEQLNRISQA
jgi:hypothetical protein